MSEKQFIAFLQSLITMTDPASETSVYSGKAVLENLFGLASGSGKASSIVLRMISVSIGMFEHLVNSKDSFAGVPGDYSGNEAKRHNLCNALYPHC